MLRATQPTSINGIEFDALINENKSLEADIPDYPTEKGFSVEDTIILKPLSIEMTLCLTNTPVTWAKRFGNKKNRVASVLGELERLYFTKKPVRVVTSSGIYENMGIESIAIPSNVETGYSVEIPIRFKQIRVTEAQTTTIPEFYARGGGTGVNAGTANTSSPSNQTKEESKDKASILYGITQGGLSNMLGGIMP